jgi:hypothetical protein
MLIPTGLTGPLPNGLNANYPWNANCWITNPNNGNAENTGLLLKRMAFTLAAGSDDKAMNLILEKFGKSVVDQLFPNHLYGEDPIIPKGTKWDFTPLEIPKVPLSPWLDGYDRRCHSTSRRKAERRRRHWFK